MKKNGQSDLGYTTWPKSTCFGLSNVQALQSVFRLVCKLGSVGSVGQSLMNSEFEGQSGVQMTIYNLFRETYSGCL